MAVEPWKVHCYCCRGTNVNVNVNVVVPASRIKVGQHRIFGTLTHDGSVTVPLAVCLILLKLVIVDIGC